MYSPVEENYLKALFALSADTGEVNVNELSRRLGLKMPTVTNMMKKFAAKKLVFHESYRPLRLTDKGRKEAAQIIRKHRLTEMFLVEKMGFGWENVHDIAEQVEHVQSTAFFEKMDELLGYPTTDPHGSPIPDRNGRIARRTTIRLSDCQPGDSVRLAAVNQTSAEFLRFLNTREIALGIKLKVKAVEAFDHSMVISYGKRPAETLSQKVCERLMVEKA